MLPDSEKELAADTANMRTAQPTISNLEQGTYTFILKVTDAKEQHSESEVNVYVKAAANEGPKADAGTDIEISLPKTWVILVRLRRKMNDVHYIHTYSN